MGDEVLGQTVEQLGVGGRIRFAHVVFRLDDAPAEEVLPVAVDEGLGEERILRVGHPVGQQNPGIVLGLQGQRLSAETRRRKHLARAFVASLGRALVVDREDPLVANLVVATDDVLAADAAEERRQAVVIVLTPLFKRVVVATGTLDSQTQEQLRHVFDLLIGLIDFAIPRDGRIVVGVARRGDDFPYKQVVGLVLIQAGPDPVVERIGRRDRVVGAALVAQHQVPLVGEVVGIRGRIEQAIDHLGPLLGIGAGQEFGGFRVRGQGSRDINVDAAQERAVITDG